jgi:hypothetical protein
LPAGRIAALGATTDVHHGPLVDHPARRLAFVLAAFALALAALASGLRPDAFFVGDPGVKLMAARNALAHPSRLLEIDLPLIGAEPAPFASPFFPIHGDHAHAITSELFPVVTVPLLAAFGLRGVYLLPAVGFLMAIGGCAWIAAALDRRRNAALTAAVAGLSTPLLFYGLEFWEHTLAVGVAAAATARLVQSRRSTGFRPFVAGVLFGIATLLRPEAAWFAVAVGSASWLLPARPRPITLAVAAAGAALTVSPLIVYSVAHFGALMPAHVSANAGLLQGEWLAGRALIASTWFVQAGDVNFWRVAPAIVCALVPFAGRPDREGRAFLWCVTLVNIALVVLTAPNDGGGQWGPRYLLFAYVPLAVLVADALDARPPRRLVAVALAAVVFAAGLWTQRTSYRRLQGAKSTYGRLVDFIATTAGPNGYVVTDLWWLDQVAAAAKGSPRFLYAANEETGSTAMHGLGEAAVPTATVIRSRSESPDLNAWIEGACFVEDGREELDVRNLVAIRVRRSCP